MRQGQKQPQSEMRGHILHVDDDPGQIRYVRALLKHVAPDITTDRAKSIEEAKELLAAKWYDACLLDLSLPKMTGTEVVRTIRVAAPALPIVVLASEEDPWIALAAIKLGAVDFLVKGRLTGPMLLRSLLLATHVPRLPQISVIALAAEASAAGLVVREADGTVTYSNAEARRLLAMDTELFEVAQRLPIGEHGSVRLEGPHGDARVLIERQLLGDSSGRELLTLTLACRQLRILPAIDSESRRDSKPHTSVGYRGPERRNSTAVR